MKKSLAAMGGNALLGIKDIAMSAKQVLVTPMGEFTVDAQVQMVRPNKVAMQMKTPMGEMQTVFDGVNAWMKGPMGTRDLPGPQREEFQKQTIGDVHYVLQNLDKPDFTPQYLRDETIDGKPVNIVIVRYAPLNYAMRLFVDAQSGLVIKKIARGMTQSGPGDIEEVFSDYRAADGVQFPFKTVATSDSKKVSEVTITSIKVNGGVKEEVFKK